MRRAALTVALAALAVPAPAAAQHGATGGRTVDVDMEFGTFSPARANVLVGDTVHWMNDSARTHTATANDRSFDSGRVPAGESYERRFDAPGRVPYLCTLHAGMVGEIVVSRLLLAAPAAPAVPNRPYPLTGRAAHEPGTPISITDAAGQVVATAPVRDDGTFAATIAPRATTTLTARTGQDASAPVQLLVVDRSVSLRRRSGRRLEVTVTPAAPGQTVVLQMRLPLRFGWWPVHRARLDRRGRAVFRASRRRVPTRVALTLRDGATVLVASRPLSRP